MKVVVEVVDAADLTPKDGQGSASAFAEVVFDGQRQRTSTKLRDLSPSWNETLVFAVADPASLPNQIIEVSVYHEHRSDAAADVHRRSLLGHVLITAFSISPSSADAPIKRFPLEKRGLFSHIRGDIALRVYTVSDAARGSAPPVDARAAPVAADHTRTADASASMPAVDPNRSGNKHKEVGSKKKSSTVAPDEPRVFYSVPEGGGGGGPTAELKQSSAGGAPPPPMSTFSVSSARAVQKPPAAATVQVRPGEAPPRARPEFGLVETTPPLAGRLGYRGVDKIASTYDLVEQMRFLYVSVVKARDLPAMDVTGSLDPYVEVKLGNYKGQTKHLEKIRNPVWRQVFAFSKHRIQSNVLVVAVKDKDLLKDDYVGRVQFDLTDVPVRVPPDSPLAPQWYKLQDKKGDKLRHGEIMLAVWIGTQADEAFPDAWHSDAHSVGHEGLSNTRSKVYFSPKLVYLRVYAIQAQDLVPNDKSRPPDAGLRLQLGHQVRRTRQVGGTTNPTWNEEFMFVASEPFDEPLVLTVENRSSPSEPLGRLVLPVSEAYKRTEHNKTREARWYSLLKPTASVDEAAAEVEKKKEQKFASKIQLHLCLEMGYHVLDESTNYSSDFQPASKQLRKSSIGILELGILGARNLAPMKAKDGRGTDSYCVAKYGTKFVRTRTLLDTLTPHWNEQYTWEVFDPCTVVTVAVFDNCHLAGHKEDAKDARIGKVRIRLSTLEADRVYTHFYPLLVLQSSGIKKTGELHLAVRFTCTAWINMVARYGRPLLPKMHYTQPISVLQMDALRHDAMKIVATRLGRAEPPLHREVVEYMLDVDSHMWSLRRSKANFYRITSLLSCVGSVGKWFDGVRNWRNPLTTILVHVLFFILVYFPELILPTIFLYLFMMGMWNYRHRPRHPPHMDTKLSYAEAANSDELDEEFDTFPTTKPGDIVRMRYDRLRSIGGRLQTVVGDLATQGERAHALLSWRDPRATTIFVILSLVAAVILYVTPFQVVVVLPVIFFLRHPRFRSKMPSIPYNFYRRLPAKSDMLI